MLSRSRVVDDSDELREVAKRMRRNIEMALIEIDAALIAHGKTRHPLVNILLDVRTELRGRDE